MPEIERRRFRREDVQGISMNIQWRGSASNRKPKQDVVADVKNVSLSGAHCLVKGKRMEVNDQVACSIIIPPEQWKIVPFSRILGRGWVLRFDPVAPRGNGRESAEEPVYAATIAFSADVTALSAISL